jgi:hypothetical protein
MNKKLFLLCWILCLPFVSVAQAFSEKEKKQVLELKFEYMSEIADKAKQPKNIKVKQIKEICRKTYLYGEKDKWLCQTFILPDSSHTRIDIVSFAYQGCDHASRLPLPKFIQAQISKLYKTEIDRETNKTVKFPSYSAIFINRKQLFLSDKYYWWDALNELNYVEMPKKQRYIYTDIMPQTICGVAGHSSNIICLDVTKTNKVLFSDYGTAYFYASYIDDYNNDGILDIPVTTSDLPGIESDSTNIALNSSGNAVYKAKIELYSLVGKTWKSIDKKHFINIYTTGGPYPNAYIYNKKHWIFNNPSRK